VTEEPGATLRSERRTGDGWHQGADDSSGATPSQGYRPWRLADLDDVPRHGLRVASLFSGCGGSSLGYKLAGFDVAYANEFVPLAAETYRANSTTPVDTADVRTVTADRILEVAGGPVDVLDGSPPCATFSIAGNRTKDWGRTKVYSEGISQRTDDLFDEYTRIVGELRPRAFVAENVAGFTQGMALGYARRVLAALRAHGYRVEARVLDAQWLGVPQTRRRTIILGVRDDVERSPRFPTPLRWRVPLGDIVPGCRGQVAPAGFNGNETQGERRSPRLPSLTIGASTNSGSGKWPNSVVFAPFRPDPETGYSTPPAARIREFWPNESFRYLDLGELRRVCSFPDDFRLLGKFNQRWERLGRAVPPLMMAAVARQVAAVLS
jgi:DNA (cytosine-5)-methyltransferase 1